MVRTKPMLRRAGRERGRKERKNHALKNLRGSTQERDRAIGERAISRLARLRNGKNDSLFPHGGKLRLLYRKVAKMG